MTSSLYISFIKLKHIIIWVEVRRLEPTFLPSSVGGQINLKYVTYDFSRNVTYCTKIRPVIDRSIAIHRLDLPDVVTVGRASKNILRLNKDWDEYMKQMVLALCSEQTALAGRFHAVDELRRCSGETALGVTLMRFV